MARAFEDIADFLNGKAGLTIPLNLIAGRTVEPGGGVADLCVFCRPGISPKPSTYLNGAAHDLRLYAVQVIIRGAPGGSEAASDLADAVRDLLQHSKPLINGGPGAYITVELNNGAAIPLKEDKEDRPRFSLNVTATAFEANT